MIQKSRIQHKHDTEAHWSLAVNFIPLNGEMIIYDQDSNYNYARIKIGDGVNNVNDLPFIHERLKDIETQLANLQVFLVKGDNE